MGAMMHLREELEELACELEDAAGVADAGQPPEVVRAKVAVDEARAALSSAFLSRRAMVLAREAVGRAHRAVNEAREVSCVLRDRSAALRATAGEARTISESAREQGALLAKWSRRIHVPGHGGPAEVLLESGIPSEHPQAAAIKDAIERGLSAAGGQWRVWITVPTGGTWWGLRVKGPDIDWVGTLQDAAEQTAEGVMERLGPLVQVAAAESVYRSVQRGGRPRRDSPKEGERGD